MIRIDGGSVPRIPAGKNHENLPCMTEVIKRELIGSTLQA
jgi:hypothetical protein